MSRRALMVTLLLGACGGTGPTTPMPMVTPGWHVSGGFVRGPDHRAVILRGVNVSGDQKSAPYLDDKQLADYQRISSDWGMNAIRFLFTWSAIEPTQGQYDDVWLDKVRERMDWAEASGLSVILDMHEDIYGEGFGFDGAPKWTCDASHYAAFTPRSPWFLSAIDPNVEACVDHFYTDDATRERFVAAWAHVATRLADKSAIIGFDTLNEPAWGSYPIGAFEQDRLMPLDAEVVAAVRAAAPGWIAFVEPSSSRNAGIPTGLTSPSYGDIVYAPHSYDANAEGGSGFDPAHRAAVISNIARLQTEAQNLGAALWIGEYGGDASTPGIAEYMTAQYDGMGAVAASSMYWDDSRGGYGLLAADGSEKPILVDTVVRPFPAKVAGDPVSWTYDAATSTFQFTWKPDLSLTLPTEISIPPRRYPKGYQVECGGCVSQMQMGKLVITQPPTSNPAIVTIHP